MRKTDLKLSIVIVFYNMRREAIRTLYSLTTKYQTDIDECDYEVIVVDSGSTQPLAQEWVKSLQSNFTYQYVETSWPSPCHAMNVGIEMANSDSVVCMIDGARMLSPGVLSKMIQANTLFKNAFVQTIAMHIGEKLQNISVEEGYNQDVEDKLFNTIDWQRDGYQLFNIACLADSSKYGFLASIRECNCFCIPKRKLLELDGFDENFTSVGGGFVNLDILNQIMEDDLIQPIMLLGEASFHQFHGGVATNVPMAEHPMQLFLNEYQMLRGKPYQHDTRQSYYLGSLNENARKFVIT